MTATPLAVPLGNKQGVGPNVTLMLNTFLPDGRGVAVPVIAQPTEVVLENCPFDWTVIVPSSPVVKKPGQLPTSADSCAARL